MSGSHNTPRVILGTMSFALETTDDSTTVRVRGVENIKPLLDTFHAHGYNELDTARFYCHGDTETVLGQAPTEQFKISTKVWPTVPKAHGSELLKKTFRESLAALNGKKVDIFYLHAPDYTTPFEETIKAVDELYREGLFERFGLSNFAAWQVTLIHELCKQNGYVVPTVYQGMYNAFTRDVVRELLPCLKALNIAFYGFNPIAGGLLSGKIDFDKVDETKGGPFDTATLYGKVYRERYLNTLTVDAVKKMEKVCKEHSLTLIESALRWMSHHAGLGPQDGIIIGASSVGHLEANLKDLEKGPLPKGVVEAYDEAWEHVKVACASYFKTQQSVGSLNAK